jgi:FkbH-like protein
MDGYYRSLEMRLTIRPADEPSLARIAQLTQKTNQFTLTTRRYTEVEIRALLEKPEEAEVLSIALRDRFGDFGLIGAAILRYRDKAAVIDSFLLSCRALGRGVEDAFLVHIAELAKRRGRDALIGEYLPSRKNGQTRDFYPRHGFATAAEGPARTEFHLPLTELKETLPAYFAGVDRAF